MAVIIERGKEPRYVNKKDGVAAPAGGVAVGGEIKGTVVIGSNKVVEAKSDNTAQNLEKLVEELDNMTYKKTAKDFTEEKLSEILEKLKLIKDIAPTSFQDIMERLGYKVELVDAEVENTGTGAVATRGQVRVGKNGIAREGSVGSITKKSDGTWKIED